MTIRVALRHLTHYTYDRLVAVGPQTIRLRPAPHSRTPIVSYSLNIAPGNHFLNWQQDPQGNFLARAVFPEKTQEFRVEVDLVAEMTVINPFDFFLEQSAQKIPFDYEPLLARELRPFLETVPAGPRFEQYLAGIDRSPKSTIDFLVHLNQSLQSKIGYLIRLEPGVQTPEETLTRCSGSCRDSAWLMVQMLRRLGLASRFVSGYLIQLAPDIKSLDGPSGAEVDFTDLHAWAEVYIPGAGWIGLDPTSGLLCGEGHIPLAATPDPQSAAPITGSIERCESTLRHEMNVSRIWEDPRVTKPYTDEQWAKIEALGDRVDEKLHAADVRLTMGGEPTFVSIDDMESAEWNTAAVGPTKRSFALALAHRLRERLAPCGIIHYGQGKWYPGEPLPRWAFTLAWRTDGEPIWLKPHLLAQETDHAFTTQHAELFARRLMTRLDLPVDQVIPVWEDMWHYLYAERSLPINVDPRHARLKDPLERARLARLFDRGLDEVVGYVIPLRKSERSAAGDRRWITGRWPVRREHLFLLPGDSPIGLRLPIDSLPWAEPADWAIPVTDPFAEQLPLPPHPRRLRQNAFAAAAQLQLTNGLGADHPPADGQKLQPQQATARRAAAVDPQAFRPANPSGTASPEQWSPELLDDDWDEFDEQAREREDDERHLADARVRDWVRPGHERHYAEQGRHPAHHHDHSTVVRTALCVEPREDRLYIFLPPVETLEDYLELVSAVEETADELQMPVFLEGYPPPRDPRLNEIKITPDPGVIEVNVQPAHNWRELVHNTTALYEDARHVRLGTEKFNLDGRHTGTGGGNHIVLGAARPIDSPFLRRPDLLRSLVGYWNNHPSLSYLFSGMFIGPTSQAPRVDEGRKDALYELDIAFRQLPDRDAVPPWIVDRLFRHLLVDVTGNTHRAEICIDKLYSPDSSSGRLGLVELRGFEMPPHARMSLAQQLLVRALVAWFWDSPYKQPLVHWGTSLHDRFLLPHFVQSDLSTVLRELDAAGFHFDESWFAPQFEFRFPRVGERAIDNIALEIRQAIEPWYVLGEEPGGGGVARYVDSSVERVQVKLRGLTNPRYILTCNGRRVPLHPTGTQGEFVAGIRFRAWQPPSCLHPLIPVQAPLVFDLVDTWLNRSLGGCTAHVAHPGGRNHTTFPINALEAESRRVSRFFTMGHTPGPITVPPLETNPDYPMTLDLRR